MTVWQFLTKLNIPLTYDPVIRFDIHTKKLKTDPHKNKPPIVVQALFIIVNTWKKPRYSPEGEFINKVQYIWIMRNQSTLEGNEFSNHKKMWKNLKHILLSQRKQFENNVVYSGKGKSRETVGKKTVFVRV
jgi:hypothetical protein